jgi:hypothetical protein
MPSRIPSARPRGGAPFGNLNALKHGFYSRRFRKSEMDDLENTDFTGLRDEIAMLRVSIRRIMEWGSAIQSFPDAMTFLRVIALATASLSRLIRTQQAIGGSEFESVIVQAISEVAEEMGIAGPPRKMGTDTGLGSLIKSALKSSLAEDDEYPPIDDLQS